MNERIKELYLQAHSVRHYDNDPTLDGNPPTVYWQGEVSAQLFAELIVRECARICVKEARQLGGRFCSDKIKDHFGVKE